MTSAPQQNFHAPASAAGAPERVLIVDDHAMVREGLRSLFEDHYTDTTVIEADCLARAITILSENAEIDLVLLDLNMPDANHLSGLRRVRELFPLVPVLMVSALADRHVVREALASGAAGFLPKSLPRPDIIAAIEHVLAGEIFIPVCEGDDSLAAEEAAIRSRIMALTPQQRVVLRHLVAGLLNKQIAHELGVSMTTVKAHVSAILLKMEVYSRTQAVIQANRIDFRG